MHTGENIITEKSYEGTHKNAYRIRDILIRIRIRLFSPEAFKMPTKISFFLKNFCLIWLQVHLHQFLMLTTYSLKRSWKCQIKVLKKIFACWWKDPYSFKYYSFWPKNIGIRIWSTAFSCKSLILFPTLFLCVFISLTRHILIQYLQYLSSGWTLPAGYHPELGI